MWLLRPALKVCCFVDCQVVCATTLVDNVSVNVPLLPVRLCPDFAADAVAAAKAASIAATGYCVCCYLC